MQLAFIHGWGLDASFWDGLAEQLPYAQQRVDLGFYGHPKSLTADKNQILVGHSLGFVHGITQKQDWAGWIAINSFPRFVKNEKPGCSTAAELRDIRKRLTTDTAKTVKDFHAYIGATAPKGTPNFDILREGLDELRDCDIEDKLKTMNVPGLVLASRNDPLVPEDTSTALPGDIRWHDTGGHILPQSDADWCAGTIKNYMEKNFT